jgi:uncharacterized membrane protein
MTESLDRTVLVAATVTSGLLAGLFYAYSASVMRGLARTADRTFVESMRQINVAILNGWFALGFVGAPLATTLALVVHLDGDDPATVAWIALALVSAFITLAVTLTVNVPLNDELASVEEGDAGVARGRFEGRWVRWNLARTLSSVAAFGCLVLALASNGAG